MYEAYFKFKEKPFEVVPNPAYLYLSRTHRQALTYMRYGLQERLGFVLMTGGVGSGKTTLIRELTRMLSPEITLARVFNTRVTSEELMAMINEDFGLETAGKGKVLLMKDLYAHLIREYSEGRRAVLIVDEAQNLSLDLLEEIRMLSNLETDDAKLLQILLVGQPELDGVLSLDEMRQFRQRISIACRIENLTRTEVEEYILHRLTVAGNRDALAFSAEAFDAVHAVTAGIPRQINTLCSFLLLTAFTEEQREASAEMVRDVAAGLGMAKNAESDGNGECPAMIQHTPGPGDRIKKCALLRALGVPSQACDRGSLDEAGADSTGDAKEYPVAVRTLGHRLLAMEKELEHAEKKDYAALKQRVEMLETQIARSPAEQRPDQPGITTVRPEQYYCDLPERKGPRLDLPDRKRPS
jgi:putative secretion ATPase (PEP-CTERM system associated)